MITWHNIELYARRSDKKAAGIKRLCIALPFPSKFHDPRMTQMRRTDYKAEPSKTNFPMRAGLPQRDRNGCPLERIGIYQNCEKRVKTFTLHDGPLCQRSPSHWACIEQSAQNMVVRSQQMMGRTPLFPWDCHGLPDREDRRKLPSER